MAGCACSKCGKFLDGINEDECDCRNQVKMIDWPTDEQLIEWMKTDNKETKSAKLIANRLAAKIKEVEDNIQVMRTAMSSTDRQGIADIQGTARHMLGSVIQNWLKESEGAE